MRMPPACRPRRLAGSPAATTWATSPARCAPAGCAARSGCGRRCASASSPARSRRRRWPSHVVRWWAILRAIGGAASGWAMIAVSALVLTAAGDDRRRSVANRMFSGVGVGIILSTLLIAATASRTDDPARLWLALGVASVVCSLAADVLLGHIDGPAPLRPPTGQRVPLPPDVRLLVASYACAGFGYVLTATYLVLIVRDSDVGRWLEVVAWCVVGACAAVSTWFWARGRRPPRRAAGARRRPCCARRRRDVGGVRARHRRDHRRRRAARRRRSPASPASASTSPAAHTRPTRPGRSRR